LILEVAVTTTTTAGTAERTSIEFTVKTGE
jgi:hypothetical protein